MRHAISTRAACLLLAATLATPGRTARAQTGPPPPTPNYSSQLAAAVGPSGELGVSSEYAFNLFGLSLLGVLFGSIANPPRDRNGDVVNVPPTTVPPHLTGQKLGAAAAQAPAVRGAFPAARAGPPPPDSLEPSVSHTLDPPLAPDAPVAEHVIEWADDVATRWEVVAEDEGDRRGDRLGLGAPAGADPLEFEQSGRFAPLPPSLQAGVPIPPAHEGDPINPATGAMTIDHEDIDIPGVGLAFTFARHYRSSSRYVGALGFGWSSSFEQYLVRSAERCTLSGASTRTVIDWYTGSGVAIRFRQSLATGRWEPARGVTHRLGRQGNQWLLTAPDGVVTVFDDPTRLDPTNRALTVGLPREIRDRNGNRLVIHARIRGGLRPTSAPIIVDSVEDTLGRVFTFDHDPRGFLREVRGPGLATSYVVDDHFDLRSATDSEGTVESYEYDHDPARSSAAVRYPTADLDRRCRVECGDLGFCGACSGIEATTRSSCAAECHDTNKCVAGSASSPSCAETCASACGPSSDALNRCESSCATGRYQLPASVCESLRPLTFGSTLAAARGCEYGSRAGLPWCNSTVTFTSVSDPSAVEPSGCCPHDNARQRSIYRDCLASPPLIENAAIVAANEAACQTARPAIRAQCDALCPSVQSCSEACLASMVCYHYEQISTQGGVSVPIPIPGLPITFTTLFPDRTWIFDRRVSSASIPTEITTENIATICATTEVLGSVVSHHPFWDTHPAVLAVNFDNGFSCENPTLPREEWECTFGPCPSSCLQCPDVCANRAADGCIEHVEGLRRPDCAPACRDYLASGCISECSPRCASECSDPTACLGACAGTEYGAACVDHCATSCLTRNSEQDDAGAARARYGNVIDLDHNLIRIRDGEGRLYLENRYEDDIRKPGFDRVVWQRFGTDELELRTYALGEAIAPEDQARVDTAPEPVELCASTCLDDIGNLGDDERWISTGDDGYLVFAGDEPTGPTFPVELIEGSSWAALPAFSWFDVEMSSPTRGTIRPATPLPPGGIRVRTRRGALELRSDHDPGSVRISSAGVDAIPLTFRGRHLTLIRGAEDWRALPAVPSGAVELSRPNACGREVSFARDSKGVRITSGGCTGTFAAREVGRRDGSRWTSIVSTARGATTWSFTNDGDGRTRGQRRSWSPGDEPWEDHATGCTPAARLEEPEPACAEALESWPRSTPRPDCGAPWSTRGAGGGALPPGTGPTLDCWPSNDPVHVDGALPRSCSDRSGFHPARRGEPHVQPFAWATVVAKADGTTKTYYSGSDGIVLREIDNSRRSSVDYNFDDDGRLVGVRDARGTRTCIQYDQDSHPIRRSRLAAPGVATAQPQIEEWTSYGSFGRPTALWEASEAIPRVLTSIEYDPAGNIQLVRRERLSNDLIAEWVSDARGRTTDVYRAHGSARHFGYDATTGALTLVEAYARVGAQRYQPGVPVLARTTIVPDARGRPARVVVEGGLIVERDFGALGRIQETRAWLDPIAGTPPEREIRRYDTAGLLVAVEGERNATNIQWNGRGLPESIVEQSVQTPSWRRSHCFRYVDGSVDAVIDPDGRWVRRRWSASTATVVAVERGVSPFTEEWAAECANNLTDRAPEGFEKFSAMSFSSDGRVVSDASGPDSVGGGRGELRRRWSYDGFGRLVRRVLANGVTERWGYDAHDRIRWSAEFDHAKGSTNPSPGALSDGPPRTALASLDPELSSYAEYAYDDDDRLMSRRRLWFARNANGTPVARGSAATRGWATETWTYDDLARRVRTVDASGNATVVAADPLGRTEHVFRGDGTTSIVDLAYADMGRAMTVTIPDGSVPGGRRVETRRFAPFGTLRSIEDAAGLALLSRTFDGLGRVTGERDRATEHGYAYDDFGRHVGTTRVRAAGQLEAFEEFGYSLADRPVRYTDAARAATVWKYDSAGRVNETKHPDGQTESQSYYLGTDLLHVRTNRAREVVTYEYDGFGSVSRAVGQRGPDESETTTVREPGGTRHQRTWARRPDGTTASEVALTFDRDSLGYVVSETSSLWNDPVLYTRDGVGRWTELAIGTSRVSRTFDELGRLDEVRLGTSRPVPPSLEELVRGGRPRFGSSRVLADYSYRNGSGAPFEAHYANGATEVRSYDDRGRPATQVIRTGASTVFEQAWVWGVDDVLARWDTGSAVGRRSFVFDTDDLGRLSDYGLRTDLPAPSSNMATPAEVAAWLASASPHEQYVLDATDRMTEKRLGLAVTRPAYGSDGRLAGWGAPVTSDALGRVTGTGTTTLDYDPFGRLAASTSGGGARTTYLYDPRGLLVGWDGAAGDSARSQYADGQIVRDQDGTTVRLLVPGEGRTPIATVSVADVYTNIAGPGDRMVASLDARGSLVERYEAVGHVSPIFWSSTGAQRPNSAIGNRMLLGGQPWTPQLDAHRQGVRWYRPEWGRFLTPDPLGHFDGPNIFAYAGMNPVRWTDPLGLERDAPGMSAIVLNAIVLAPLEPVLGLLSVASEETMISTEEIRQNIRPTPYADGDAGSRLMESLWGAFITGAPGAAEAPVNATRAAEVTIIESAVESSARVARGVDDVARVPRRVGDEIANIENPALLPSVGAMARAGVGIFDRQIAAHALKHFPGKSVEDVMEIIAEVRAGGQAFRGANGKVLTRLGNRVLIDDLLSPSRGTIYEPTGNITNIIRKFFEDNL